MRLISQIERDLVAPRLTRMNRLIQSGAWTQMTHEEAYDAVYGQSTSEKHKQDRLENIARATST